MWTRLLGMAWMGFVLVKVNKIVTVGKPVRGREGGHVIIELDVWWFWAW